MHIYVSHALIRSNSTFSTYEFCTVLIVSSYYFLKQLYQVYLCNVSSKYGLDC
jgi:hypothetical protein